MPQELPEAIASKLDLIREQKQRMAEVGTSLTDVLEQTTRRLIDDRVYVEANVEHRKAHVGLAWAKSSDGWSLGLLYPEEWGPHQAGPLTVWQPALTADMQDRIYAVELLPELLTAIAEAVSGQRRTLERSVRRLNRSLPQKLPDPTLRPEAKEGE